MLFAAVWGVRETTQSIQGGERGGGRSFSLWRYRLRAAVHFAADVTVLRRLFEVMAYASPKQVCMAASMELARAAVDLAHNKGLPVVGFDLAGAEAGYPADDHSAAYQYAHSNFIRRTVHAAKLTGRSPYSRQSRNATPTASATGPGCSHTR